MTIRKENLTNEECYHVFSRSISKYIVFNDGAEYSRLVDLMSLCRYHNFRYKYSEFVDLDPALQLAVRQNLKEENEILVEIVAYCLMPTHIHLVVQQVIDDGIAKFIGRILNGYSRYFNTKHKRLGPLWSSRFKSVHVSSNDQLLHLTRYIHLNPTSANIVKKPEEWQFSSYNEYNGSGNNLSGLCKFEHLFDFKPAQYKKFVESRKLYQKDLAKIKKLIIEDYAG